MVPSAALSRARMASFIASFSLSRSMIWVPMDRRAETNRLGPLLAKQISY